MCSSDLPLQVSVRNAVAEIRRFTDVKDWYHIATDMNVADLGTRGAEVDDIGTGSAWQNGQEWMRLPREQLPIKTAAEVTLSSEEAKAAAAELRASDVKGHQVLAHSTAISERYAHSQYLLDPCKFSWSKSVRIMAEIGRAHV